MIEAIRAAVAQGATAEQKAIGAQACRTILAALGAEPGKPIVLPGAPKPDPLSGITVDHALDLVIARLTMVANARDATAPTTTTAPATTTPPAATMPAAATTPPERQGPQIPPQPERRGPQIPPQPERRGPQIPLVRTPQRPVHAAPQRPVHAAP